MDNNLILIAGIVVTLLACTGIFFALQEMNPKSIRTFDYFFLGAVIIAYAFGNYLWFIENNHDAGQIVGIWVAGSISLGLYFRSIVTRTPVNQD
jgi:hypothetical protein